MALLLQAGPGSLTGSRDPKLGIIAIKMKCYAETLSEAIFGDLPEYGISGLVEYQPRTWDRMPAGDVAGYEVIATVEGHTTPDSADGVEYSLQGTTKEEPIDTHPNLAVLKEVYGGTFDANLNRTTWPEELPNGSTSGFNALPGFEDFGNTALDGGQSSGQRERNPMHGVESYLVPALVWKKKWVSQILPAYLVGDLGTLTFTPPGNPPTLSRGRVWIVQAANVNFRGNIWQIEEGWLLSGPNGVAPELYPSS